ncbi:MAG: hypothetical protein F9K34_17760 [Albidovulum sp.]|uniref:hypothetical protein n=1 Tax=Albidovulum sp. TaxID=1872424 RepID=UPI0013287ED6|nr:hypothetical protein [Defluviimonas sp.]KAB2878428.1 MAG: hypothetical protein F9K34_17760 [Defluviimonas sp.]
MTPSEDDGFQAALDAANLAIQVIVTIFVLGVAVAYYLKPDATDTQRCWLGSLVAAFGGYWFSFWFARRRAR